MSVKIMGIVWEAALPQREKFVLLAYADHADHEGGNVFPSVGLIAWKTGYSERSIQRITKDLIETGILIVSGMSQYHTNKYRIVVDAIPRLTQYKGGDKVSPSIYGGDILSGVGVTNWQGGGDKIAGGGDTAVSPPGDIAVSPKPSLTIIKPSVEEERATTAAAIFSFNDHQAPKAERIYQQVTGQMTIPSDYRSKVIENLTTILDYFNGREVPIETGKAVFARWCSTTGKSGKPYSKTNPGWIGWWLEELAPSPVSVRTKSLDEMSDTEFRAYLRKQGENVNGSG